ncbi:MAG: ATP-binding protein [Candidatus Cloacimonetes bacterium]|nr:ATP-binding protein [Candidatus Cloacimonadota bacterium]MDY0367969.1 ATP-binding protein [Candidatus Syntrophosphaera sp.]
MKQSKLVKTRNVVEADACISFLKSRPKLEMVGLGLLYGRPGSGKTTFAQRMAFREGYLYLRLEATTTPKSFSQQLLLALYKRFNLGQHLPYGTANNLFKRCLSILEDHADTVVVIDEIDYAFKHESLLGAIRDIVDETLCIVVLVGMQTAKDRLAQINPHYFDRCNYFCEFKPASRKDIELLAKEMMEVEVTAQIIESIHFNCNGNLRKAMKLMYIMESRFRQNPHFTLDKVLVEVEL